MTTPEGFAATSETYTAIVAALRYRLCDAAFRAKWAATKRDQGQLRAEAYGYSKAIEDVYSIIGVTEMPYTTPRIDGHGRLDNSAETVAREWIGPASSGRVLGKRP